MQNSIDTQKNQNIIVYSFPSSKLENPKWERGCHFYSVKNTVYFQTLGGPRKK